MVYPTIYRVSNIQGGAGFLPSTVACQLIGCPFMAERPMHPRTCGFACGSIPARILSAFRLEQVPILFSSEGENRRAKNWSESWIQRQQQVIECLAGIHLTYPYFSFRSSMIPQNLTISIHILPYFSMWMSGAEASNWIRTSSSLLGWTSFSSWRNAKAPRRIPCRFCPCTSCATRSYRCSQASKVALPWVVVSAMSSIDIASMGSSVRRFFSLLLQWKRPRTTSLCLPDS